MCLYRQIPCLKLETLTLTSSNLDNKRGDEVNVLQLKFLEAHIS